MLRLRVIYRIDKLKIWIADYVVRGGLVSESRVDDRLKSCNIADQNDTFNIFV